MTRKEKITVAVKSLGIGAAYMLILGALLYPVLDAGRWMA